VKRDAWIFGVSGAVFGVLVGWIIGTQRGAAPVAAPPQTAQQAPAARNTPPALDSKRAAELEQQASARPGDPRCASSSQPYFDARRFDLAIPAVSGRAGSRTQNGTSARISRCRTRRTSSIALKQIDVSPRSTRATSRRC
jgi:hypothetical protein